MVDDVVFETFEMRMSFYKQRWRKIPSLLTEFVRWLSLSLGGTLRWYLNLVGREAAESPHFESVPWVPLSLICRFFYGILAWFSQLLLPPSWEPHPNSCIPLAASNYSVNMGGWALLNPSWLSNAFWSLVFTQPPTNGSTIALQYCRCHISPVFFSYFPKNQTDLGHSDSFLLETINKL